MFPLCYLPRCSRRPRSSGYSGRSGRAGRTRSSGRAGRAGRADARRTRRTRGARTAGIDDRLIGLIDADAGPAAAHGAMLIKWHIHTSFDAGGIDIRPLSIVWKKPCPLLRPAAFDEQLRVVKTNFDLKNIKLRPKNCSRAQHYEKSRGGYPRAKCMKKRPNFGRFVQLVFLSSRVETSSAV